jgi:hypothetical protein
MNAFLYSLEALPRLLRLVLISHSFSWNFVRVTKAAIHIAPLRVDDNNSNRENWRSVTDGRLSRNNLFSDSFWIIIS